MTNPTRATPDAAPSVDVDEVFKLTRPAMQDHLHKVLASLRDDDLTDDEVIALSVFLRPVYERVLREFAHQQHTGLKLVADGSAGGAR